MILLLSVAGNFLQGFHKIKNVYRPQMTHEEGTQGNFFFLKEIITGNRNGHTLTYLFKRKNKYCF